MRKSLFICQHLHALRVSGHSSIQAQYEFFFLIYCLHALTTSGRNRSRDIKDEVINVGAGGADKFASFVWLPGSGHLVRFFSPIDFVLTIRVWQVVQTKPKELADKILLALDMDVAFYRRRKPRL
jgi:hypothetical protein